MNPNNMQSSVFGFYSSMASCFKKYSGAAAAAVQTRRTDADGSSNPDGAASMVDGIPPAQGEAAALPVEPEVPELPEEPKLPPGVLCQLEGGIVFKILTEEYVEQATDLLCHHFFKDEPLGRALSLESPREVDHWLSKLLPHLICHGVSVMALDETKGKLVGVSMNGIKTREKGSGQDEFLTWINPQNDPKMYRIISFLNYITSDIDFFSAYGVDKMFTFELLNVDKGYGGRGIASLLVEQSINVARDNGFKLLLTETTGIFSAKIFSKNGFKTIREVPYSAHRENGKPVFPVTGIHTSAKVSIKQLD